MVKLRILLLSKRNQTMIFASEPVTRKRPAVRPPPKQTIACYARVLALAARSLSHTLSALLHGLETISTL